MEKNELLLRYYLEERGVDLNKWIIVTDDNIIPTENYLRFKWAVDNWWFLSYTENNETFYVETGDENYLNIPAFIHVKLYSIGLDKKVQDKIESGCDIRQASSFIVLNLFKRLEIELPEDYMKWFMKYKKSQAFKKLEHWEQEAFYIHSWLINTGEEFKFYI